MSVTPSSEWDELQPATPLIPRSSTSCGSETLCNDDCGFMTAAALTIRGIKRNDDQPKNKIDNREPITAGPSRNVLSSPGGIQEPGPSSLSNATAERINEWVEKTESYEPESANDNSDADILPIYVRNLLTDQEETEKMPMRIGDIVVECAKYNEIFTLLRSGYILQGMMKLISFIWFEEIEEVDKEVVKVEEAKKLLLLRVLQQASKNHTFLQLNQGLSFKDLIVNMKEMYEKEFGFYFAEYTIIEPRVKKYAGIYSAVQDHVNDVIERGRANNSCIFNIANQKVNSIIQEEGRNLFMSPDFEAAQCKLILNHIKETLIRRCVRLLKALGFDLYRGEPTDIPEEVVPSPVDSVEQNSPAEPGSGSDSDDLLSASQEPAIQIENPNATREISSSSEDDSLSSQGSRMIQIGSIIRRELRENFRNRQLQQQNNLSGTANSGPSLREDVVALSDSDPEYPRLNSGECGSMMNLSDFAPSLPSRSQNTSPNVASQNFDLNLSGMSDSLLELSQVEEAASQEEAVEVVEVTAEVAEAVDEETTVKRPRLE